MRSNPFALVCVAVALAGSAGWTTYVDVSEAYGLAPPPPPGQVAHKNVWFDPLPVLAVADSLALLVVVMLLRAAYREATEY